MPVDRFGITPPRFVDVGGDGVLDLVLGSYHADVAGVVDAGAVYHWDGGSSLVGAPPPVRTFAVPGAHAQDWLGRGGPRSILLRDVTTDGIPEIIVGSPFVDYGGVHDTGAMFLWDGTASGPAPAPSVDLAVPGAAPGDTLGY